MRSAVAQVLDCILHSVVVESHAVDQREILGQAEQTGTWISRLRFRRDGSDLRKSESQREQLFIDLGILVESGCDSNRISEPDTENLAFQRGMANGKHPSQ